MLLTDWHFCRCGRKKLVPPGNVMCEPCRAIWNWKNGEYDNVITLRVGDKVRLKNGEKHTVDHLLSRDPNSPFTFFVSKEDNHAHHYSEVDQVAYEYFPALT